MTNQKMIVGIGRAFTDVIANVDDAFLTKFNIPKGIGLRISEEKIHQIISELKNPIFMAGGSVANTISGLNALGHSVSFIGKTGDDESGRVFMDELTRTGVPFFNNIVANGTTGTCLCLNTSDGERSFAFSVGVCEDLTPADMPLSLFDDAAMMVLQVMMLETVMCFKAAREIFPKIPSHVKKVMCLHDLKDKNEITDFMLQHIDVIIGSRTEFYHILDVNSDQELKDLCRRIDVIAAMTIGSEGAVVAKPERLEHISAVQPAKIVDTVGAGDFFAAGFLYGLANDWDLKDSGDLGAKCASLIIEEIGGRPSDITVKKMKSLLQY